MGYRLGVDLGTTFTAAVISRPGTNPTVVPLGDRSATIPSVLFFGADGTVLMGEAAERRALTDPDRVVRRFKRRIGDETPLLVGADGDGLTAHAIAAKMIALVTDRVAEQEGGAPDALAVTVPAAWGAHKKELLSSALQREGLLGVGLISEPTAAALAYSATGRLGAGTTVAVYDFGGGTFDAALLRATADGTFTPLGTPSGLETLGGIDFDDAVLAYTLGTAGPQTPGVDLDDPAHVTAMARLRRECVDAKEALSADTAATVPVLLGGVQTSVRITRGEFEAMIAGAVEETCTAIEATLVSAHLTRNNLDRILLTGGTSRIPLVTQLLSARYPGVALERDIDPKLAVAIGAVLALETGGALPAQGRQAATAIDTDTDHLAAPVALLAPVAAASIGAPERPALDRDGFDREPGTPLVRPRNKNKRKTPVVLMVAAGLIMSSGVALSALGTLEFRGGSLPNAGLQEAHAGTKHETSAQLETEALEEKADATSKAATTKAAESGSTSSTESSTSSGRTEGSADSGSSYSGSSDSSESDASTAERASEKSGSSRTSKDQASASRKAAKADSTKAGANAPAAQPAAPAAPAASTEVAAPAEAEDTSTDSGSIEAFNDGSQGAEPVSPPSGS